MKNMNSNYTKCLDIFERETKKTPSPNSPYTDTTLHDTIDHQNHHHHESLKRCTKHSYTYTGNIHEYTMKW